MCQDTNNDELVDLQDWTRLCSWHTISDDELAPVFSVDDGGDKDSPVNLGAIVSDAKNLIRWCLKGKPEERPTVAQILAHRFLSAESALPKILPMQYHAFLSHAQADASGTVATLYHEYRQRGLHCWLDMRQEKLTLEGMKQGVRDSQIFLLVLSERVLMSWFCQQEMLTAIDEQKPIQLVIEEEPRFHPFDRLAWESVTPGAKHQVSARGGGEVELPPKICAMVDEHLPQAVTFRRRDFELHAMMHELCHRSGVPLPQAVDLPRSADRMQPRHVSVIHNPATAGAILDQLQKAIMEFVCEGSVALSLDHADLRTADSVLVLLTGGIVAASSSSLEQLVQVIQHDSQSKQDRIVAVFSEGNGWSFGCAEHKTAPMAVQACIDDHEATAFRPPGRECARQHEFDAMMTHLLGQLGCTGKGSPTASSPRSKVLPVVAVRERLLQCERELAEKEEQNAELVAQSEEFKRRCERAECLISTMRATQVIEEGSPPPS